MSIHDALRALKEVVDDCEDVIKNGRLAVSTKNVETALMVVKRSKELASRLRGVLEEAALVLNSYNKDDSLAKFTSTYYRMAILVSLPYVAMILREIAIILEKGGHGDEAGEARSTAENLDALISTLKSRR